MKAPLGSRQAVDEALGAVGLVVASDLVELLPGTWAESYEMPGFWVDGVFSRHRRDRYMIRVG